MKKQFLILLMFLFASTFLSANNLRITNITQVSANQVQFSLSWENSWRVGGAPGNHDAVWVFIKYRECGQSGPYIHALLSTTMGDYKFGTDANPLDPASPITAATTVSLADRFGNIPAGATETNGLGNNTGIMIRRADYGKGNIDGATCTVKIVTASGDPFIAGTDYEIKVIGIEMVLVGEGGFTLGDNTIYNNSFIKTLVTNENAIPLNTLAAAHAEIPDVYPKGYNSFYCMKYEITEGQFYKFMTSGGNLTGSPSDYYGQNRNLLSTAGTVVPDRAQNYMSWGALLAYLDWAALRPMSELEYEKACKGTASFGEQAYAWGENTYQRALYVSGTEDGTETVMTSDANCHCYERFPTPFYGGTDCADRHSNTNAANAKVYNFDVALDCSDINPKYPIVYSTSYDRWYWYIPVLMCGSRDSYGYGPLGAGIFARDGNTDGGGENIVTTGATYYSIMEMSGNVAEQCVDIVSTGYEGTWGDGKFDTGFPADWPLETDPRCIRGGGYSLPATNMRVCDRQYNNSTASADWGPTADAWRKGVIGGRGVR